MRFERSAKRDCVFSLRSVGVVHMHTGATLKHICKIQNGMLYIRRVGYMYIQIMFYSYSVTSKGSGGRDVELMAC